MNRDITKIKHRVLRDPPLHVVLYQPEIPANTGNIARLCGASGTRLHLIHPLGFRVDDRHLKRAGLDYWHEVDIRHHGSFDEFLRYREKEDAGEAGVFGFSRHALTDYTGASVNWGDYLLFGRESEGLPDKIRSAYPCFQIPMWGKVRSLNLSTAAGIVVYHHLHAMGRF